MTIFESVIFIKKAISTNSQYNGKGTSVDRYLSMLYCQEATYFDINELEEITDHFVDKHDFVKALEVVNYGLALHACSNELTLRKADLLAAMNKNKEALRLLNKLEKVDPNNPELFIIKGSICSELGKSEDAIEHFLSAINCGAEMLDDLYMDVASEYQSLGDNEAAITFLKKALNENPYNDNAIYEIAYLFEELDASADAINFFNQIIDQQPYSELAWFYLGAFKGFEADFTGAIEAYDYAIAINEKYVQAHYEKGHAYLISGEENKAIDSFSETINLDPNHYNAYFYLGRAYDNLKDESKALASYSKAVKINKNLDVAWLEMALMLERNNKNIDAV